MNRFRCKQVESVAVLGFKKLAKTFFTDTVEKSSHIFKPFFTRKSEVKAATMPALGAASRQDFRAVAYSRFLDKDRGPWTTISGLLPYPAIPNGEIGNVQLA